MKGNDIGDLIKRLGFTQKDIADLIGETPQNFNSMLRSEDVRSSLIERISGAIKRPVSFIYGEGNNQAIAGEGGTAVAGDGNTLNAQNERFLALLEEKDRQIGKLLDLVTRLSNGEGV